MDLISSILAPSRILIDAKVTSRDELFALVSDLFERDSGVPARKIRDGLLQREKLGSTGLGMGIAIPHQRIKGLKEALGAFVRLAQPLAFDAPDGEPVRLFFVMLVPEQANETHLRLLAELAQRFSDRAFREVVCAATDVPAVRQAFGGGHAAG
ncbi:MAG: PTS sugar transporter subunit IIA [Candidatus Dactylopiibacterium sp.]|nr:PTS sugar transporter subunit IIA [Candidatus Dactylopiibacterium sp.]